MQKKPRKRSLPGYEYIKSSGGIDEYRLKKNGLAVLLMEEHSVPVVNVMVTYHVGSRNEALGYTGATHLLEHLLFKGSKKFNKKNKNDITTVLETHGARVNATTWNDRTNYYELLSRDYLDEALAFEADRMRHAFLREGDRASEMTVVRNEFERGENSAFEALDKQIWTIAYQAHPYHHSTIGWRSDIEHVSTKRLKEFYDTFYWPNNATVSVLGDFDRVTALQKIAHYFGVHPRSPHEIPGMHTTEPKQEGERRVTLSRIGQSRIIGVAHKSPEGLHPDTYPLTVLGIILAGGKASRLYRALVDKGAATEVLPWTTPLHDNGLFITYAFLTPGTAHASVEKNIVSVYEGIKKKGVTGAELSRAKAVVAAETAFGRDGVYAIAGALNEAIAIGDWTFYTNFSKNIEAVTREDVQRVAQMYLVSDQSTVGYCIPKEIKRVSSSAFPKKPRRS